MSSTSAVVAATTAETANGLFVGARRLGRLALSASCFFCTTLTRTWPPCLVRALLCSPSLARKLLRITVIPTLKALTAFVDRHLRSCSTSRFVVADLSAHGPGSVCLERFVLRRRPLQPLSSSCLSRSRRRKSGITGTCVDKEAQAVCYSRGSCLCIVASADLVVVKIVVAFFKFYFTSGPRLQRDYPPNLSISFSGGKETNWDSFSRGD